MRWLRFVLVLVGLIALAACHVDRPSKHDLSPGVDPAGSVSPTLPDGWRWESYHGVEAGVPTDWGWGSGDQRLGQWCLNGKRPKPIVGRPGVSTQAACVRGPAGSPPPETLIKNTGWIVAFEAADEKIPRGGDRQVITYGHVSVVVQAPETLRTQIIATIHLVKVDHHGCPSADSVSRRPAKRPSPAVAIGTLRYVVAVSVCRYDLVTSRDAHPSGPQLASSSRIDGAAAERVVDEIAAAPVRGGPDRPQHCTDAYGDELIVLRVTSSARESEVYVRYSGCDHHGFDDGTVVRGLTRAPMQSVIAGPNQPQSWDSSVDEIVGHRR